METKFNETIDVVSDVNADPTKKPPMPEEVLDLFDDALNAGEEILGAAQRQAASNGGDWTQVDENFAPMSNILLVGPSGTGKTTMIHNYCNEENIEVVEINLASMTLNDFRESILKEDVYDKLDDPEYPVVLFLNELSRVSDTLVYNCLSPLVEKHRILSKDGKTEKTFRGLVAVFAAMDIGCSDAKYIGQGLASRFLVIEL